MNPAIIVVAYNRHESLTRLLCSLARSNYPAEKRIPLVISLDKSDNAEVRRVANDFDWKHGEKEIVEHPARLGLRKHVLHCGDLVDRYESICMLEDDLYVSPWFYFYAVDALEAYALEDRVAGISLYTHKTNVHARLPFTPIEDGGDTFFLQIASSWGQAWTCGQWRAFRDWYARGQTVACGDLLPENVIGWPESSWLKYFIKYMVTQGKYFTYPRVSYTTNFSDQGTHNGGGSCLYQVPLQIGYESPRFISLDDSLAVYDSFFECDGERIKKLNPKLSPYRFDVDLYGLKSKDVIKQDHVLTSKRCRKIVRGFSRSLKPAEMNVIQDNSGTAIALSRSEDVTEKSGPEGWEYFFAPLDKQMLMHIVHAIVLKVQEKVFRFRVVRPV